MKQVIIMVGASGSGKSTWAKQYLQDQPGRIVSADNYFTYPDGSYHFDFSALSQAHATCQALFNNHLKAGEPVIIVDNTSTRAWERKGYIEKAKEAGYKVFLKVFKTDPQVCAERNTHGVPLTAVTKMSQRIDVEEGFYEVEP